MLPVVLFWFGLVDALRAQIPSQPGEALYLHPAGFDTGPTETVSPDGRLALFWASYYTAPHRPLRVITLLVDLQNGRVLGRGEGTETFDAWGSDRRHVFVEREKTPGDDSHLVLDCLDIPTLSRAWTIPYDPAGVVSFGRGGDAIIAEVASVRPNSPTSLNLELISRRGVRRRILSDTLLLPVASVEVRGVTEIICKNTSRTAAPLELLGLDGSKLGKFGPPIPPGASAVYASPTQIAWQDFGLYIAFRHGQSWVVRQIQPPYEFSRGEGWPLLERSGSNHLMLLRPKAGGGTAAAWSVNWDGVETPLHWPKYPETDDEVIPWIDGKHLVIDRVTARRIDFVDGVTGKVVRSFREVIAPPEDNANRGH